MNLSCYDAIFTFGLKATSALVTCLSEGIKIKVQVS